MSLQYIGNVAWRQNKPPAWDKTYIGDVDTCRISWQGAQYLEKAFLDGLTKYQNLVYINEVGTTVTDTGMHLTGWSSDDAAIFPSVSLSFTGTRGGVVPDALAADSVTAQSSSTTFVITDNTSPNFGKAITMSIQYYASRTVWRWVQLTDPAGVAPSPKNTVRNPKTYTGPYGDPDIYFTRFSGMVNADGTPSNTISTADATAVWNTFIGTTVVSGLDVEETVPSRIWKCSSTVERLLVGTGG